MNRTAPVSTRKVQRSRFVLHTALFVLFALFSLLNPACRTKQMPGLPGPEPQDTLAGKFRNPVRPAAPDPWVFQKDSFYYFMHTTGSDLRIYKTTKMSELSKAFSKVVWTPPATGLNNQNIWAPELHHVDGKWYIYYAADNGNNAYHRVWVLENPAADPLTGSWTSKGKLNLPDDRWAIDATVFRHAGQLYCLWSGWAGTVNARQDIYICKLANPWTASGPRVLLSKPELPWETGADYPTVNEGPEVIKNAGRVFITYSARGCWTDDYSVGLLTADSTANLLDPAAWTKSPTPIFTKNPAGMAYGPGHNAFFTSPDRTEHWLIYHANAQPNLACGDKRSTRIQPFTWKADGSPELGMPVSLNVYLEKPSGEK